MNDATGAKQQIVERIKDSSNILVTVSTNPSVDELSAALGLTIMLNNIKKHATAVVSGDIPPAISFLEPTKTFEHTVDSLRDFIIALDKEKADHLRYKVEGDVVKIFITPYRTTISQNDLDFSQGDYNVELVLALGVRDEANLDTALEAHGRILHDATVATFSCGEQVSKLGSIDWSEPSASSISEMLVSLSEAIKTDKPLLDEQVSTALLTGIVAATDRFSNNHTTSKVMTMAAQLMAAGANQQLIAAKLQEENAISGGTVSDNDAISDSSEHRDGTKDLAEGASTKLDRTNTATKNADEESSQDTPAENPNDGSLAISHEFSGDLDQVSEQVEQQNAEEATEEAEDALAEQLDSVAPATVVNTPSVADLQNDLAAASADVEQAAEQAGEPVEAIMPTPVTLPSNEIPMPSYEPTMGGTLSATAQEAEEEKRREEMSSQNHTILHHGSEQVSEPPTFGDPAFGASTTNQSAPTAMDFSSLPPLPTMNAGTINPPSHAQTLAELDAATRQPHEEARDAVAAAFEAVPSEPTITPLGSASSFQVPSVFTAAEDSSPAAPAINSFQDNESSLPPLPDFTTLPPPPPPANPIEHAAVFPPQHPDQLGDILPEIPAPTAPVSNDPGQFKIPGQH